MGRMVANIVAVLCVSKGHGRWRSGGQPWSSPGHRYMSPLPGEAAVRYRQGTRGRPPPAHLRRLPLRERSNSQKHAMKTLIN